MAEYKASAIYSHMTAEYDYPTSAIAQERTEAFKESVAFEKTTHQPKKSPFTTGFGTQVLACTRRQYQILWGEKSTFLIKQILSLVMALIAGSCFYNAPQTSAGLFTKGGAVFFSLLYNTIVAMSEVTESFKGRPVLIKHKAFAFYHPAAFCLAQITADFPVLLFQCTIFSVVLYWMVGLKATAAAFFTFWIILFTTTLVSSSKPNNSSQLTSFSVLRRYFDALVQGSVPSKPHRRFREPLLRESSCMLAT